jgi:SnoaL-like domain
VKSEGMESQVKKLNKTIRKLEARMQKTEDIEAIKKLQDSYGYYLEHWQEEDLIALFSHNENVAVEINDFGLFKGWEGIKSCYHFEDHYPNYPGLKKAPGEYLHILIPMAGIVDVAPDGLTAKGRWYGYFLGAQRREGELRALIGCGIWENDFIKEDGIWRILKIFWNDIISSPLDEGWVKTPDMLNPKHKDAPPAGPNTTFLHYPSGYIFPYHYKNPVTGK